MLDCLRLVPTAKSAGALKCFFTLLNRVKVVDSGSTGQLCSSLLNSVAQCYSERKTQWNSLLRTRYGLYGNPFDPVLFDFDAPQHTKMLSNSAASYAGAISSSVTDSASAIAENAEAKEILALSMNEKSANTPALAAKLHADLVARHIYGLLEVEPLHYTVASSSDGTKVERLDAAFSFGAGGGGVGVGSVAPPLIGAAGVNVTGDLASAIANECNEIKKMAKTVQKSTLHLIKVTVLSKCLLFSPAAANSVL